MKALANKWYVYYLEGDEDFEGEEVNQDTPWDELTLIVDLKNNEVETGDTRVLMVQAERGFAGWWTIPWNESIADYNKPLPQQAHKHFIKAIFNEI